MTEQFRTGGCQCGAIRFRIRGELGRASICHCRMCQKAFGGFFGPLIGTKEGSVEWTRGEPTYFQSSVNIDRGFCQRCGTPLTYRTPVSLDIAIGAFDQPDVLVPKLQLNNAFRIPWVETIFDAPVHEDAGYYARQEQIISFQHPDHDTENWPEKGLHL